MVVFGRFFFFKQKTAYEMRISDWSSDVCSSDLCRAFRHAHRRPGAIIECRSGGGDGRVCGRSGSDRRARSEEHTSELQSLMRISYAVFRLKKKKKNITTNIKLRHPKVQHYTYTQYTS